MVGLARERQRDEAEQVDHEDEEQQRATYGNQRADRLGGSPCSRDLRLGDLVDRLADRLPCCSGSSASRLRIVKMPSAIVQERAEHQVDDRLRDREVERAEVNRDPLVLLELRRRVEVAPREGGLRREQRERRDDEEDRTLVKPTSRRSR